LLVFCLLLVFYLYPCVILQEAQKMEAARNSAGAQPSRAAQAMAPKAPSPAVEVLGPENLRLPLLIRSCSA
jgi:hypothetical protein